MSTLKNNKFYSYNFSNILFKNIFVFINNNIMFKYYILIFNSVNQSFFFKIRCKKKK